ncbi:hypothetical protein PMZ80_010907 [Knufia obscura]|uniref:Ankyrin repeat domain-containing protein n=1 Tax=Knufia obscura TaxID=1635080 RepID=A0ABR0R9A3_9EURO|nr:hypothetical protein PMZ80_010907 [Knufia obscura]
MPTTFEALLDKGAQFDHMQESAQSGALVYAAARGSESLARKFFAKGAGVPNHDAWNDSALDLAAKYGHRRIVAILVDAGAQPEMASTKAQLDEWNIHPHRLEPV